MWHLLSLRTSGNETPILQNSTMRTSTSHLSNVILLLYCIVDMWHCTMSHFVCLFFLDLVSLVFKWFYSSESKFVFPHFHDTNNNLNMPSLKKINQSLMTRLFTKTLLFIFIMLQDWTKPAVPLVHHIQGVTPLLLPISCAMP